MVLQPLGAADHGDLDQGAGDDGERGQDDGREDPGPLADVARPGGPEEEGAPRPSASPPEFTKTQRSHPSLRARGFSGCDHACLTSMRLPFYTWGKVSSGPPPSGPR